MLHWALRQDGPVAIRYARSKAPTIRGGTDRPAEATQGEVLRGGSSGTILAVGPCLVQCLEAAEILESEGLSVGVADARSVKPLDAELLDRLSDTPILTVEENTLHGGFGSAVLEHFHRRDCLHEVRVKCIGFPDAFIDHATRAEQLVEIGLDAEGIASSARALLGRHVPESVK